MKFLILDSIESLLWSCELRHDIDFDLVESFFILYKYFLILQEHRFFRLSKLSLWLFSKLGKHLLKTWLRRKFFNRLFGWFFFLRAFILVRKHLWRVARQCLLHKLFLVFVNNLNLFSRVLALDALLHLWYRSLTLWHVPVETRVLIRVDGAMLVSADLIILGTNRLRHLVIGQYGVIWLVNVAYRLQLAVVWVVIAWCYLAAKGVFYGKLVYLAGFSSKS